MIRFDRDGGDFLFDLRVGRLFWFRFGRITTRVTPVHLWTISLCTKHLEGGLWRGWGRHWETPVRRATA